ncbi:S1 RNA-binding domain-containing protein 1 [Parasteatoda tepidariorum]|uniref:S1 RNA-binding domain-containing protein 1 n=1 Tax=Parasteatoda tepidariorum TaxID=114398 RepID=UPI001C7199D5|nr:S1 RNA-binding domain-containing protein 1 [Parasteatoda tepidariorum]XP_042907861.1 S1 RNA-binding domain-containing protein 1 [Parasteatoda tepidariorum]XP_042907862.1 S1 RNA-binding domain-containing protein 1 [Parasteatoda tepidariorum]XP_042907863.1 S1 RNA-binding domain-containing protein 1 [Parasteatoda tepidariorum]XP_042907864.1 S1 RNA-binding domain-containing protein 1 [Parasteatoda tepidariorum]
MELPQKRKRNAVIKIESFEDEEDATSEDEKDDDFLPMPKKKKTVKAVEKVPKPAKIKKEKPVKIKVEKPPKVKKVRAAPKGKKTVVKNESGDTLKTQKILIKHEIDGDLNAISNVNQEPSMSNADIEKLVAKSISEAKRTYHPWGDEEVVAQTSDVPIEIARNVINLLNQECTIPFIVRYRKQLIGGLSAEKLREVQDSYEEVKHVHKKVENILKTVKHEKFDEKVATAFLSAKTLDEVELLYAPFKPGSKRTLAERSKQLGLEPLALQIIDGRMLINKIDFNSLIKPQKGLENQKDIITGIQHIIADIISKDRRVLDFIVEMSHHNQIRIISTKSASAEKADRAAFVEGKNTQNFKYENYFDQNILIRNIAAHQVMALNRGEKQKVLKIKIEIPKYLASKITDFIWKCFFDRKYWDVETNGFLKNCIDDAYERLIEPYITRQIRGELTKKAERESISVFGSNVRSLLLTPPVRGKTVIGIDPGFSHGCKIGVVSSKGEVLCTDVIYPHTKSKMTKFPDPNGEKILGLISNYRAEILAIGNGTACRETEVWLSNLIKAGFFHPFEVKYCIVNENGVSIYSVTKEAEAELPGMDPNLRSAVSIARRLQDPLLEYVKVEPKHLGVGMYQHDVAESQLKKALDSIVEECVSFVGVDLNVCPETMLRKISGLSASRAKQIVEWRTLNGCFMNRQQLLLVKGLGQKSFEQCAGFVKILPETSSCAKVAGAEKKVAKTKKDVSNAPNPLDRTIIHPESYNAADKFLQDLGADPCSIGQQSLIDKVNSYMRFASIEDVATKYSVPVTVMQLIVDALKQLQDYDIRAEFDQPLFRTAIRTFSDLATNQELTGRVTNVTGFGAFVDVGVERNGLIHVSKMKGQKLNVGDRVTVKVLEVNAQKKRIGLEIKL